MRATELATGWIAAWTGRDATVFGELCEPDVHYEDPLTEVPLRGPAALAEYVERLWTAFPDVTMEASGEVIDGGERLAIPVRLSGTHLGELGGLPGGGRAVSVHALFYAELADGRLRRVRAFVDLYDAGTQLGVLPARGTLSGKALLMLRGFGLRARG